MAFKIRSSRLQCLARALDRWMYLDKTADDWHTVIFILRNHGVTRNRLLIPQWLLLTCVQYLSRFSSQARRYRC